ncbi:MAG: thymidine phosphorylase [Planctomycetota bacterium]|nr:thymidine phosphorylase [Planctomycetota bacterium]
MDVISIIRKKRDGSELTDGEISWLIDKFHQGDIPDYQMAAWAMAVTINDMSADETFFLTRAMFQSGGTLELSDDKPRVDKHSTGGVGDKISLMLAPLLACFGLCVPMISGRGLGITGGTLDKLEAIPGFNTNLTNVEIDEITSQFGCVISGATDDIAPADAKLYTLRDITGTVASTPLITASILSKKLAENLDALVMDVKCGSGSSMKTISEARTLANSLISTASRFGLKTTALITDMSQPLGNAVGNACEIHEVLHALQTGSPSRLIELSIHLASELLKLSNQNVSDDAIREKLTNGETRHRLAQMIEAQGGNLPGLPEMHWHPIQAPATGYLLQVQTDVLGQMITDMGGGRAAKDDSLDHSVGISLDISIGDFVNQGDTIARIAHPDPDTHAQILTGALEFSPETVPPQNLILEFIH